MVTRDSYEVFKSKQGNNLKSVKFRNLQILCFHPDCADFQLCTTLYMRTPETKKKSEERRKILSSFRILKDLLYFSCALHSQVTCTSTLTFNVSFGEKNRFYSIKT